MYTGDDKVLSTIHDTEYVNGNQWGFFGSSPGFRG